MQYTCKVCNIEKPIAEFHKKLASKTGHSYQCKRCRKNYNAAYYKEHQEIIKARVKTYRTAAEFPAKNREWQLAYRIRHREELRIRSRKFTSENPHKHAMWSAARQARERKQTPKWLTKSDKLHIEGIYEFSRCISIICGILHHVDHIVPLRGKDVSGLHVPWNLRIITATENIRKGNKLK